MKAASHHTAENQGCVVETSQDEDNKYKDRPGHQLSDEHPTANNDIILMSPTCDQSLTREQSKGEPSSGNLGPAMSIDNDERSVAMAPFPSLETLSLAHNLVGGAFYSP